MPSRIATSKISERYINYVIWCFVHAVTTEWNYYYLTHANSPVFSESMLSEYRIELLKSEGAIFVRI